MQTLRTLALALAATALVAGCGPKPDAGKDAPTAPAPVGKDAAHQDAGALLADLMSPTFTVEQQGRILNMGYFMAASSLCPDLEVDAQKMGRAVDAVLTLGPPEQTDAEKAHQRDAVIMFLGMSSGAMIGSHIEDKTQFCEDAAKVKGGAPETHLFAAGPPTDPSTAPVPANKP
ncbi:hypothetical protein CFHF_03025 [Caulobacter flavus]|jgi:hypothetical protein|uniref:Lipoprotein n=1 Tax=Caulobacter flavus TaxID=1679497 RepID=A0A2N5CYV8_9CAUL|nr:hypothetical protein [Caulobacter flavus]AYV45324.1 hypothetical protein C1707_03150 [Caulobacter flavus]PLR18997.1 hypothetical protein CFHF_03025 [Caulobacter flavus]